MAGTQATCQDIVQQRARKIVCAAALPDGRIVSGNQNGQLMLADKSCCPKWVACSQTLTGGVPIVAARQDGLVVSVGQGENGNGEAQGLGCGRGALPQDYSTTHCAHMRRLSTRRSCVDGKFYVMLSMFMMLQRIRVSIFIREF